MKNEELIKHLRQLGKYSEFKPNYFLLAADRIEELSGRVEVKHGEFICLEQEIGLYKCSLCDYRILRAKCNYCPNCGARMDKETEVTDNGNL